MWRSLELVTVSHLATSVAEDFFFFLLSGCTSGEQKGIDWEKRSTRNSAWDSREIRGSFEGRWSIHCMCIVIVMFLLISAFAFFDPMFSLQVVANMRGTDAEEVAERVKTQPSLSGLQVKFENSWGSQAPSSNPKMSFGVYSEYFHWFGRW